MAAFNRFNSFLLALASKQHNLAADTFKVMLTNTSPVTTQTVKADIAEIAAGNGYAAGGPQSAVGSLTQSNGTVKWVLSDTTITASGGSIGPARYAVLYNATSGLLIGWWDYGSPGFTLAVGETVVIDYDDALGAYVITPGA